MAQTWLKTALCVLCTFVLLTACTNKHSKQQESNKQALKQKDLEVSFNVVPEKPIPNMRPTLKAMVKQSGRPVTNGSVVFEVWADGIENHQKIRAEHKENGLYAAESTLTDCGNYQVVVHASTSNGIEKKTKGKFSIEKRKCCHGH